MRLLLSLFAVALCINVALAQTTNTNPDPVANAPHPPTSHFSIVGIDDSRSLISISQELLFDLIGIDLKKIENSSL